MAEKKIIKYNFEEKFVCEDNRLEKTNGLQEKPCQSL